ncbi:IPT/TIG domain-containing protein [Mucilaginibacter sp. AW1-3]
MKSHQNKFWGVLLLLTGIFGACKHNPDIPNPNISPTIISVSKLNGVQGDNVLITGTDFSAISAEDSVKFNGTYAAVTMASSTTLNVLVPAGGSTGPITVKVKNSTAAIGPVFSYQSSANSVVPDNGIAGDTVVITGTDFLTAITSNIVKFNGVAATVIAATNTQLTVQVPAGASTGLVTVLANTGVTLPGINFTINPPGSLAWQQVGTLATNREQHFAATAGEKVLISAVTTTNTPYVYYSSDGTLFSDVTSKLPFTTKPTTFYQLISNAGSFYLSTDQGLASTSDGQNWTLLFNKSTFNATPTSIVFVNTDMYVCATKAAGGVIAQFFKSTNNGGVWSKISDIPILNLNQSQRGTVVKTSNNTFYAIGGTPLYNGGVYSLEAGKPLVSSEITPYKSTDFGLTWNTTANPTYLGNSFGSLQNMLLPVANNLYCIYQLGYFGALNVPANLYRSADGGATWQAQNSVPTFQTANGLRCINANATTMLVADENKKLDVTTDNGTTYQSYSLPSTVYETFAVAKSNKYVYVIANTFVGGVQYNNAVVFRAKLQ